MKTIKSKSFLDLFFLILISVYIGLAVFRLTDPLLIDSSAKHKEVQVQATETKFPPVSISIAKLKKDLPIAAANVHNNEWDLFDDKISWLSTSATPGEGNVILYGHNRVNLFGNLYLLQIGDEINVQTNSKLFRYKVSEVKKVMPSDVNSILSSANRLTLYTCEGSFDQKRLVVYADLVP